MKKKLKFIIRFIDSKSMIICNQNVSLNEYEKIALIRLKFDVYFFLLKKIRFDAAQLRSINLQ